MAWVGIARSNYVKVKDGPAFEAALAPLEETISLARDRTVMDRGYCLMALADHGWTRVNQLVAAVAPHLADGEVCVLVETGFNRRSYGTASALAFNGVGEQRRVDLADIYTLAKELGDKVSPAEY